MPTPNGPKNQPRYDINDEPAFPDHVTAVSDYAALVGNRKVGTKEERQALSGNNVWDGLSFFETDTGSEYVRVGGSWTVWNSDSGWLAIPSRSGNYNSDLGASYKVVVRNGESSVKVRGQLSRKTGNMTSEGLFTFPSGARPPYLKNFLQPTTPGSYARLQVNTDGSVAVGGITGVTTYISLDNIQFETS